MSETKTVMMPRALTAENGAKSLFMGEFYEIHVDPCGTCDGSGYVDFEETVCGCCEGKGHELRKVFITWATIKAIYAKCVEHFGE